MDRPNEVRDSSIFTLLLAMSINAFRAMILRVPALALCKMNAAFPSVHYCSNNRFFSMNELSCLYNTKSAGPTTANAVGIKDDFKSI